MLKRWIKQKWLRFGLIGLSVVAALALIIGTSPVQVIISGTKYITQVVTTGEGNLSIEAKVALAVETGKMGTGEPVPQQLEPIMRKGGVPIISINYIDGIHVNCVDPIADIYITQAEIKKWTKNRTVAGAEEIIEEEVMKHLEIWILLSEFPADDPVMQDPPILLDNERIEKRTGKNHLVTTLCYFDVHCYNLNFGQGDFITRFNGLDAGPITGEWWQ